MEMNDLEIAENIKNRDITTYEFIIEKYSKQLYYLTYNILHISGTKEDMEECVSDVFAEIWYNIEDYNPTKASFKTWILMLTKYKALKYKRNSAREKTTNIDDFIVEDRTNIEKQILIREDQEKVTNIISRFNKIDKELFIRRYFYDERIENLMDSLNLSRSAVDNRLLRCRKIIKEEMAYDGKRNF